MSAEENEGEVAAQEEPERFGPPQWNAAGNVERLVALPEEEDDDGFEPTGDFVKDYLHFVEKLDILPHPDVYTVKQPPARVFTEDGTFVEDDDDDEGGEEEVEPSTAVSVKNHFIDQATIQAVALALPAATTIVQLKFYNAGLTAEGIDILLGALPNSSITAINIEYNPLLASAAEASPENSDTSTGNSPAADASDAEAKPEDSSAVLNEPSLKFSELLELPLTSLWLRGNEITPVGATALAKRLYAHSSLQSLNLYDNKIGKDGAQALVDMLYCNRSVTQLVLGRNQVPACVASKVLQPICDDTVPPHVAQERQELNINPGDGKKPKKKKKRAGQGPVTDVPQMYMEEETFKCEINSCVQAIDLSDNNIGDEAVEQILSNLRNLDGGAVAGESVGLVYLGLARVGTSDRTKELAVKTATETLPQLQLQL